MNAVLRQKLNEQINKEYYSAYLYLAMSDWLLNAGWPGAAKWMAAQYREEVVHAEGLYRWLQRVGEKVDLATIEKPKTEWTSLLNVFEEALEHEKFVTASIYDLVAEARKAGDVATARFLDWYVMEQVEEEQNGNDNILGIQRCAGHAPALIHFDNQLGARSFESDEIPYLD